MFLCEYVKSENEVIIYQKKKKKIGVNFIFCVYKYNGIQLNSSENGKKETSGLAKFRQH